MWNRVSRVCVVVSVFLYDAVWLRVRICRFVVAVARSKGQATAFMCSRVVRNRYIIYFNIIWCDDDGDMLRWSFERLLSSFSFLFSLYSISFDFRCSGSVNLTTSVHKAVPIPHSHTIMRTTRSVHYFCRSWIFFCSLLVSSSICSPLILHRSKLIPLWLL